MVNRDEELINVTQDTINTTPYTGQIAPPPYPGLDPPHYQTAYPGGPPPQYERYQTIRASPTLPESTAGSEEPPPYSEVALGRSRRFAGLSDVLSNSLPAFRQLTSLTNAAVPSVPGPFYPRFLGRAA